MRVTLGKAKRVEGQVSHFILQKRIMEGDYTMHCVKIGTLFYVQVVQKRNWIKIKLFYKAVQNKRSNPENSIQKIRISTSIYRFT